jgi:hypothetical protein
MKPYPHKVFERDRILRDENLRPVGRVILARPYVAGENVAVSILRVPKSYCSSVLGRVFYLDGKPYRVPRDLNTIKVGGNGLDHLLNNFYLEVI